MSRQAQLKAYCNQAIGRIGGEIAHAGLHAQAGQIIEGPHTLTFKVSLLRPRRAPAAGASLSQQITKLMKLAEPLALALGVENVTIRRDAHQFAIQIPHPSPWSPTAGELLRHAHGLTAPVALDDHRRPVTIELTRSPVTLFVGPPGSGKSEAMRSAAAALAARNPAGHLELYIAARKAHEWAQFEALDQTRALDNTAEAIEARLKHLSGHVLEQRGRAGQTTPAILIIVDDLAGLVQLRSQIGSHVSKLATDGRALQMFLFIGTHAAGKKSGLGEGLTDDAAGDRFVYKPTKSASGNRDSGARGIDTSALTNRPGDCYRVQRQSATRCATAHQPETILDTLAPPASLTVDERTAPPAHQAAPPAPPAHQAAPGRTTGAPGAPPVQPYSVEAPAPTTLDHAPPVRPVQPAAAPVQATPAAPQDLEPPTIEENRRPDDAERAAIVAWIQARAAAGEETSQNAISRSVWGKKSKPINRWSKELLEEALATTPAPLTQPGPPTPEPISEEERIRQQIAAGEFDWTAADVIGRPVR